MLTQKTIRGIEWRLLLNEGEEWWVTNIQDLEFTILPEPNDRFLLKVWGDFADESTELRARVRDAAIVESTNYIRKHYIQSDK